jgi:hypothetical protein
LFLFFFCFFVGCLELAGGAGGAGGRAPRPPHQFVQQQRGRRESTTRKKSVCKWLLLFPVWSGNPDQG